MTHAQELSNDLALAADPEVARVTPPLDTEEQLLCSLRSREDSGFETLVRCYGSQVMAIARRYLRSEADAADCFQDTFVAIFPSIDSFKQESSFRYWVRGITVNQCLMNIRKRQRRREESIEHMLPMFDDHGNRVENSGAQQNAGIGEALDAEQLRRVVRENIDKLPDDYRLVVLLRDIDVSPCFEIVKPVIQPGFDHRQLEWHKSATQLAS